MIGQPVEDVKLNGMGTPEVTPKRNEVPTGVEPGPVPPGPTAVNVWPASVKVFVVVMSIEDGPLNLNDCMCWPKRGLIAVMANPIMYDGVAALSIERLVSWGNAPWKAN